MSLRERLKLRTVQSRIIHGNGQKNDRIKTEPSLNVIELFVFV